MRARVFATQTAFAAWALVAAAGGCAKLRDNPLVDTDGGEEPEEASVTPDASDEETTGPCTEGSPTDPKNCGRCGHDCVGGTCAGGVCQAVTIATSLRALSDLAVSGAFVYWVEYGSTTVNGTDGRIARAELTCSAPTDCAQTVAAATRPISLALTAPPAEPFLYFGTFDDAVLQKSLADGGLPTTFTANEPEVGKLATDDVAVFSVRQGSGFGDGTIQRKYFDSVAANSTTIVPDLDSPYQVIVFQQKIVFSTRGEFGLDFDGEIWTADVTGQNAVPIVTAQPQPRGVAANTTHIYWANAGNGSIHRARWNGTEDQEIVTGLDNPTSLQIDSERIYWAERGVSPDFLVGRVRSAKLDGTDVKILVDAIPAPSPIALDAKAVYVGVRGKSTSSFNDGSVLRVAKP